MNESIDQNLAVEGPAILVQLLCCALADDPAWQREELPVRWRQVDEDEAWNFCEKNDVTSIVAQALSRNGMVAAGPRWKEALGRTEGRIALFMAQLDRVSAALAWQGIRMVALKNSGIARGIYPEWGGCPMGDIDVLVDRREFRRAHDCLLSLGYALNSRSPLGEKNLEEAEQSGGSEYELKLPDGSNLWFELQWRPVAGRWIRHDQEPPADELIARSVPIEGTAARLLAPEDNLLQVCLHTAKHSYVRAPGFRLHTDVDRIVRRCPIDWDVFCSRVERIGVRTAVYLSLLIPAELLRTPVPAEVLERLNFAPRKHRLMLRWLERVGWFNPKQKKWSKLGYIGFNLLLYDTLGGVVRAVLPDSSWMIKRYEIRRRWTLPAWYLVRAFQLLFKRANT